MNNTPLSPSDDEDDIAPAYAQTTNEVRRSTTPTHGSSAAAEKKQGRGRTAIIALIVTLVLAVAGVLAAVFLTGGPETSPVTPNPTTAPVETTTPSATPSPTATETPEATATPSPTATTPTNTDLPTLPEELTTEPPLFETTEEEDAYYVEQINATYTLANINDQQLVGVGKKACQRLGNGESFADIFAGISSFPDALKKDTAFALGAGVSYYCPSYADQVAIYDQGNPGEMPLFPTFGATAVITGNTADGAADDGSESTL